MSLRTEKAYLFWIRRYVQSDLQRHPRDRGAPDVEAFLTSLAVRDHVAPSTQNQALAAVLFLYRHVLQTDLPWLANVTRATRPRRIPVVLSRDEARRVLAELHGVPWLLAGLLYGSGLQLEEALSVRVKDIDFARRELVVREGKGRKDRVTTLPELLCAPLKGHITKLAEWFANERHLGRPGLALTHGQAIPCATTCTTVSSSAPCEARFAPPTPFRPPGAGSPEAGYTCAGLEATGAAAAALTGVDRESFNIENSPGGQHRHAVAGRRRGAVPGRHGTKPA